MRNVRVCTSEMQANIIKEKLEQEGILVLLLSEDARPFVRQDSNSEEGLRINVSVPDDKYEEAMAILEEDDELYLKCPSCGSEDLTYEMKEKVAKTIFIEIVTAITMSPSSRVKYNHICKNCGNSFSKTGE